jgi:DNA (cytosine-5)-methyltransferase 1
MVAFGEYATDGTASAMKQRDYKDATDLVVANCLKAKANLSFRDDSDTIIRQQNTVRRLTPLECERLQGYPDNYTNIPGASDAARYKALGNSFAIPCADFVIRRCKEVFDLQRQRNTTVT